MPRRSAKRRAALPSRTAISTWPLEPTSASGSSAATSAYVRLNGSSQVSKDHAGRASIARQVGDRVAEAIDDDHLARQVPAAVDGRLAASRGTAPRRAALPTGSCGVPMASAAAAGAKTSRPWKVGEAPCGTSSATRAPSRGAMRAVSTPLSGPSRNRWSAMTASAARGEPTPGSTTTKCTVPGGKLRQYRSTTNLACVTSCGGDVVGDVHQRHVRRVRQDDPLHLRHVAIRGPEVGEQRDDGSHEWIHTLVDATWQGPGCSHPLHSRRARTAVTRSLRPPRRAAVSGTRRRVPR